MASRPSFRFWNKLPSDVQRSPMASCPSFHFYNKLPSDVRRLIFEEAFEASGWKAVELAHVSREVRDW